MTETPGRISVESMYFLISAKLKSSDSHSAYSGIIWSIRFERVVGVKTALDLVQELSRYVMPPPGVTIEVTERPSHEANEHNWQAAASVMDPRRNDLFSKMVAELRRSDRIVDWSEAPGPPGHRKVAVQLSKPAGR
jgi:hypothetical protein